jgi:nucleotide-binding universal stress UspA family protein
VSHGEPEHTDGQGPERDDRWPGGHDLGKDGPSVIVVGIDDSVTGKRAGWYAAGLARRQGARLVIVFVCPVSVMAEADLTGSGAALPAVEVEVDVVTGTRLLAARVTQELGISMTFVIAYGDPYREITRVAEETRADAIVVGMSRKAGHRLMGSVAVRLARASKCPVTVVP